MLSEWKIVLKLPLRSKITDKNAIYLTADSAMRSEPIRIADAFLSTLALCTSHTIKYSLLTVQARFVFGKQTGFLQVFIK